MSGFLKRLTSGTKSKGKGNKNDGQHSRMTDSSAASSDYSRTASHLDSNSVSSETSAPEDPVDPPLGAATASSVNETLTANSNTETVKAGGNSSAGASGSASNTLPSPKGHGCLDTTPAPSGAKVDDSVQRSDTGKGSRQSADSPSVSPSDTCKGSRQSADSPSVSPADTGKGSRQSADSPAGTGKGSRQSADSPADTVKSSRQSADSPADIGTGSRQSADSPSDTGKGSEQTADSPSETGTGSKQSVGSPSDTGEGSAQSADSSSNTDKDSAQSADSASNTDKGSAQSADSASNTGEGSALSADSAPNTDKGLVQPADIASGIGEGSEQTAEKVKISRQTAGSVSNNLPEAKYSDSFGGVLQELKRRWRFYLIMSLTVGGTAGLAAGIVGTMFTMTVHNWFTTGPQTTDISMAEIKQAMRTEFASMRDQEIVRIKDETELKLTNLRREMEIALNQTKHNMTEFGFSLAGLTGSVSQCQQNYSVVIEVQTTTDSLKQTSDVIVKNVSDLFNQTTQLKVAGQKTSVEIQRLHNTTALQNETLRNETRNLRADFDNVTFSLRNTYQSQLETATKALEQKYNSMLNEQMQRLSSSIAEISDTCEQRVEDTKKENHLKMQDMEKNVVQKLSNVDSRQDFMFTLIHQLGFMRLDTWGPILLILGAIEFVLMFLMCRQGAKAGTAIFNRGVNTLANGQPQQANRPSRADWLRESGDRGDNRLCVVCFRKRDLPRVKEISETLVQGMRNPQRVHLETYVVDTRADILRIPACRAALVFVDPDERLMILEDRRHHMGGDRRDTVQELIDTDVDVTLVIYDDPTDGDVARDDLYHRRLSQVREHNLLKQLDQKKRVVSVKKGKPFADWQRNHIVKELDQTFK